MKRIWLIALPILLIGAAPDIPSVQILPAHVQPERDALAASVMVAQPEKDVRVYTFIYFGARCFVVVTEMNGMAGGITSAISCL